MSTAWEVTTDDVANVLRAHGAAVSDGRLEQIVDELDHDEIGKGVLYYTDMDEQTQSAYSDIEDHLMRTGAIPQGSKQFVAPD